MVDVRTVLPDPWLPRTQRKDLSVDFQVENSAPSVNHLPESVCCSFRMAA
jgi:hypothetical protein